MNLLKALNIKNKLLFVKLKNSTLSRTTNRVLQPEFLIEIILPKNGVLTHNTHLHHLLGLETRCIQLDIPPDHNIAMPWNIPSSVYIVIHLQFLEGTLTRCQHSKFPFGRSRKYLYQRIHHSFSSSGLNHFNVTLVKHSGNEEYL